MTKLVTEQIPIIITKPVGEAPRLSISRYLALSLKSDCQRSRKGDQTPQIERARLTFNLNEITKAQLDTLSSSHHGKSEVVSFNVPEQWKQVNIPLLSDNPIKIDDPS